MQVNKVSRNAVNFTGIMNNRVLLKGLEKISEHGTSFAAGTSLVMSLTVRPAAIFAAPDVEKENKQYACANSICSGLIKFGMIEAIALPVENAVKKIDKNPEKYLKPETVKSLQGTADNLIKSKSYKFGAQLLKLGTGFLTAVPKSMLTIAMIPFIMDKLFHLKKPEAKENEMPVSAEPASGKKISFTGNLAKGIGKVFDNVKFQDFAKKHCADEANIAKHITAATDILLTSSFIYQTEKSKDIKENRKKALIYNNVISTCATLAGGYAIDRMIKTHTGRFIEKFSKANQFDPKLHKYIEGINILRPALIFAGIYYGILPIFSTYTAERIDKHIEKNSKRSG